MLKSAPTIPVTWPLKYRGALTSSDGHGAARVEDEEDVPGKVLVDIIVTEM